MIGAPRALSSNPLTIHCTGGSGNASALIGSPVQSSEEFSWGGWLRKVC